MLDDPPAAATASELDRKRLVLAKARHATRVNMLPAAGGLLLARVLARAYPLVAVACILATAFVVVRSVVRYRRLKAELGLGAEYDELDENASWTGKMLLGILALIVGIGALVFFLGMATKR